MKNFYFIFLIFLFSGLLQAQHPILSEFTAQQVGNEMLLRWTIISGSTCNGILIERSMDGVEFIEIGAIEGICGNLTEPTHYEFYDENPLENVINYYRLELGFQGNTDVISATYNKLNNEGFLVYPNPTSNSTKVFFLYKQGFNHCFKIYDTSGRIAFIDEDVMESPMNLSFDSMKAGLYYGALFVNGEKEFVTRLVFY